MKAVIREAANNAGLNLAALAKAMEKDKGSISRALNSDSNIELLTMFEFSEALRKEWKVCLVNREQDLGTVVGAASKIVEHSQTSWSPIVPKAQREKEPVLPRSNAGNQVYTYKLKRPELA